MITFRVHESSLFSLCFAFFADAQEERVSVQLQTLSERYVGRFRLSGDRAEECTCGYRGIDFCGATYSVFISRSDVRVYLKCENIHVC